MELSHLIRMSFAAGLRGAVATLKDFIAWVLQKEMYPVPALLDQPATGLMVCAPERRGLGRLHQIPVFLVGRFLSLSQPKPVLAAVNVASQKTSVVQKEFVSWMGIHFSQSLLSLLVVELQAQSACLLLVSEEQAC